MTRRKTTKTRGRIRHYRGKTLHSDLELNVFKQLYRDRRVLKKSFEFEYEPETIPYVIESTYTPDFVITTSYGKKIYVECKGYLDDAARRKMVAVRKAHPDLDIRILFQKNNKIRKGKTRYTDWAMRNNFNDCAVGEVIPVEWLTGETINNDG